MEDHDATRRTRNKRGYTANLCSQPAQQSTKNATLWRATTLETWQGHATSADKIQLHPGGERYLTHTAGGRPCLTNHQSNHLDEKEEVLKHCLQGVHEFDPHENDHGSNPLSFSHHQVGQMPAKCFSTNNVFGAKYEPVASTGERVAASIYCGHLKLTRNGTSSPSWCREQQSHLAKGAALGVFTGEMMQLDCFANVPCPSYVQTPARTTTRPMHVLTASLCGRSLWDYGELGTT